MYRRNAVAPGDIVMTPTFHCVPCPGLIKRTEPLFCVLGASTAQHNVIDPLAMGRYYGRFRFGYFSEASYAEAAYGLSEFLQQHNEVMYGIKPLHASSKFFPFHNLVSRNRYFFSEFPRPYNFGPSPSLLSEWRWVLFPQRQNNRGVKLTPPPYSAEGS
jgi:hypothetical protein